MNQLQHQDEDRYACIVLGGPCLRASCSRGGCARPAIYILRDALTDSHIAVCRTHFAPYAKLKGFADPNSVDPVIDGLFSDTA